MVTNSVSVRVFASPAVACGAGITWEGATNHLHKRLRQRLGEGVAIEFIEMFSPHSFDFPDVLRALEQGGTLPIVRGGEQIVSQGTKLAESRIVEAVTHNLAMTRTEEES
jgi:hypothetical protein